jgi:hypothetical protein
VMGALSKYLRDVAGGGLTFWCQGCKEAHTVWVGAGSGPRWSWNGDVEKPVFGPSVLVTYHRGEPPVTPENLAEYKANPWPQKKVEHRCHTFVGCNGAKPGEIIFLSDCTHELAGKVMPLAEMPVMVQSDR